MTTPTGYIPIILRYSSEQIFKQSILELQQAIQYMELLKTKIDDTITYCEEQQRIALIKYANEQSVNKTDDSYSFSEMSKGNFVEVNIPSELYRP